MGKAQRVLRDITEKAKTALKRLLVEIQTLKAILVKIQNKEKCTVEKVSSIFEYTLSRTGYLQKYES